MRKKIFATCMAVALTLGMSVTAFAQGADATFKKTYKLTNASTTSPAETFTFGFSGGTLTKGEDNGKTAPDLDDVTIEFGEGAATMDGVTKNVSMALEDIEWPSVGIYTYTLKEKSGNTAGVTYSDAEYKVKLLVTFDDNGNRKLTEVQLLDKDETDKSDSGFTNEYSAGALGVTKVVTGNLGDKNKAFNVTVTFTAPEGKTVGSTITYMDEDENGTNVEKKITPANWTEGVATARITLKHEETVTFNNVPYDVEYSVVEDNYTSEADGYKAADYASTDNKHGGDGTLDSASETVTITNSKGATIETGISMDTLPYLMVLFAAAAGLVVLVGKKRSASRYE